MFSVGEEHLVSAIHQALNYRDVFIRIRHVFNDGFNHTLAFDMIMSFAAVFASGTCSRLVLH